MKCIFMGSSSFAVPSLLALIKNGYHVTLVFTRADKPKGRGLEISETPVKKVALSYGMRILQPKTLKDPEIQRLIAGEKPDFIVVASYGRILPPEILFIPRFGCINVHGSLLPKYRGAAPIQWAIIKGEKETGVTIMQMDEGIDTGGILDQAKCPIHPDDTAETLHDRLAEMGAELLIKVLEGIMAGQIMARPQDHNEATYAPLLKKDDGLIKWERSSLEIINLVRGMESWPGAFTFTSDGLRLRVFPFLQYIPCNEHCLPGTIISVDREGAIVRTGDGAVLIKEGQVAGGKRTGMKDLLNGRKIRVGMVLGQYQNASIK